MTVPTVQRLDRHRRLLHFDNQFVVPLIGQFDDDGAFRVVRIPDVLAVLVERGREEDAGQVRTHGLEAMESRPTGLALDTARRLPASARSTVVSLVAP
jgi:hypothetical protein